MSTGMPSEEVMDQLFQRGCTVLKKGPSRPLRLDTVLAPGHPLLSFAQVARVTTSFLGYLIYLHPDTTETEAEDACHARADAQEGVFVVGERAFIPSVAVMGCAPTWPPLSEAETKGFLYPLHMAVAVPSFPECGELMSILRGESLDTAPEEPVEHALEGDPLPHWEPSQCSAALLLLVDPETGASYAHLMLEYEGRRHLSLFRVPEVTTVDAWLAAWGRFRPPLLLSELQTSDTRVQIHLGVRMGTLPSWTFPVTLPMLMASAPCKEALTLLHKSALHPLLSGAEG